MKKHFYFFLLATFLSSSLFSQVLIGTPKSLILLYNYSNSHFYLEIPAIKKEKTQQPNVFLLDNKVVQVKTISKLKFLALESKSHTNREIIQEYIKWEADYLKSALNFNIGSKTEVIKTDKGEEVIFWTYDMPMNQANRTETTIATPTQKQMFVLKLVKDYVVGLNIPLLDAADFNANKAFLIAGINSIVESDKEINAEDLNKKVNK
jgi:hypothetical protein